MRGGAALGTKVFADAAVEELFAVTAHQVRLVDVINNNDQENFINQMGSGLDGLLPEAFQFITVTIFQRVNSGDSILNY
jgi:hypothetical protein